MEPAPIRVTPHQFERIHKHLTSYMPAYRNMHLRDHCQRKKKRELRYLHAMFAEPGRKEIEGMISGPGIFWHYKLINNGAQPQMIVVKRDGDPKALARIEKRFLGDIDKRISQEEKETEKRYPKLSPGQFYLRRSLPGMPATHPHCRSAVKDHGLHEDFVSKLSSWNLRLLLAKGDHRRTLGLEQPHRA